MEVKSIVRKLTMCSNRSLILLVLVAAASVRNFVSAQDDNSVDNSGPSEPLPYPTYHSVPRGLTFTCADKQPGYYADPETQCQVWHWCVPSGHMYDFLCPNGTLFNQAYRVCDWFYNVNCEKATSLYSVNDDLYKDKDGNLIQG